MDVRVTYRDSLHDSWLAAVVLHALDKAVALHVLDHLLVSSQ